MKKIFSIGRIDTYGINKGKREFISSKKALFIFGRRIEYYLGYITEWSGLMLVSLLSGLMLVSLLYPLSKKIFCFNIEFKEKIKRRLLRR